jgi:hypothetical protein
MKGHVNTHDKAAAVLAYGPGSEPSTWRPGDFILTHGPTWSHWLIRFGQRLGSPSQDHRYAHWDHAALVVSEHGDLIESVGGRGVVRSHAAKYRDADYLLVHITASASARREAVRFAEWAAAHRTRYGWFSIVSIFFALATKGRFTFLVDGQEICSGVVARALERTGALFCRTPSHIMPAELAKHYGVETPPAALAAVGQEGR